MFFLLRKSFRKVLNNLDKKKVFFWDDIFFALPSWKRKSSGWNSVQKFELLIKPYIFIQSLWFEVRSWDFRKMFEPKSGRILGDHCYIAKSDSEQFRPESTRRILVNSRGKCSKILGS
jgi:hypothetical protein